MSSTKVTMLLTKKTILGVSKSIPFYVSPRLSTASLSTAYERAEGSNAVAEGSSEDGAMKREDKYEVKQEDLAMSNDADRDGPIKAVEEADMVRDTAKESMDGAWIAAQETSHKGGDAIVGASAQGAVKATEVLENVGERAKEIVVDTALDAANKTTKGVTETTTMVEADNNVVDTVEYSCTEDLGGQLGDGHDSYN